MRGVSLGWGIPGAHTVLTLVLSSAVAGLATAPIGAAHFNALSHYGLFANTLSVPLMGAVVVPSAVVAGLLAPLGFEEAALWVMGLGLRWILEVSHFFAGLDGARSFVPGPPSFVLPLFALGALFLILWQGRLRWLGAAPAIVAVLAWVQVERPAVLIAEGGALVGILTPEGRALSKPRGAGFIADNWLENDGDAAEQQDAAARWSSKDAHIGGLSLVHLSGKRAVAEFEHCKAGEIIVANLPLAKPGCLIFDPGAMQATGAVAVRLGPSGPVFETVRDVTGQRMWSRWPDSKLPEIAAQLAAIKDQ